MRIRQLLVPVAALLIAVMPAMAHTHPAPAAAPGAAQAQSAAHKAVVNGQEISQALVHKNRIYVPADGFAAAIGASVNKDENGVYWIKTGKDLPTLAELTALNPALAQYQALSPYIPGMGIHLGVPGPSLVLATSNEGTVNAVEVLVPAAAGWFPWYDQPEGQPFELEGLGQVYSQHLYLTQPDGLVAENAGVPVVLDGRYLSSGYDLKGHMMGETLYIPLRTAVELLGGSISWDQSTLTATATVQPNGISLEWLKQLNPALSHYQALSEFIPNMGIHYGAPGPHVTTMTDSNGKVVGFELVSPAAAGWAPWFDQPENQPMELPGLGQVYTQHIYLVDPASIQ
ncbi:MAG: hypothetical protein ACOY93_17165 [Bacillota bacterium]